MADLTCRSCGGVEFEMDQGVEKITRGKKHRWILMESSWCKACGEDVITTKQIEINECRIRDAFKGQADAK